MIPYIVVDGLVVFLAPNEPPIVAVDLPPRRERLGWGPGTEYPEREDYERDVTEEVEKPAAPAE